MAVSPATICVTNEPLADELALIGQRLIELSMQLRAGFDVPVEYVRTPEIFPGTLDALNNLTIRKDDHE